MRKTYKLAAINDMEAGDAIVALGGVFENSPWVVAAALKSRPFASRDASHEAMMSAVLESPRERQLKLLRAHPELGGDAARSKSMTDSSTEEQGNAGLAELDATAQSEFDTLNAAYRAKFGFPFIIAVREHTYESIVSNFRGRVQNRAEVELANALREIAKITRLRLNELISDP